MALKLPFSFLVIFAFLAGHSIGVFSDLGGRKIFELDPSDPKVAEIAKFAVQEYDRLQKSDLTIRRVIRAGVTDVPKQKIYSLIVSAFDFLGENEYDAVVSESINGKKLLAFKFHV